MKNTQVEIAKSEDVKVVKSKIAGMQKAIEAIDVKDQVAVKAMAGNIKKLLDYVEERKAVLVDPAKSIIEEAKSIYDPFINACKEGKATLTNMVNKFIMAEREKEEKEKERILAKEKIDREKIQADLEAGKITAEKAAEKIEQKEEKAVEKLSEVKEVKSSYGGVTTRMISTAIIENPELVPDEYWVIDEIRVRKLALAGVVIPGVKIEKKSSGSLTGK